MTETTGLGLGCYSDEDMTAPSAGKNQFLTKVPGPDSPLIIKLVPDYLGGRVNGKYSMYWKVIEHQHIVKFEANGKPVMYTHPCQKSLGKTKCAECDKFWDLFEIAKSIDEKSQEGKKMKILKDLLNPKEKGWINFVTPGSDVVKAMKLTPMLINILFGKEKTKTKEAIPSLIEDMKKKGMSPFDLNNDIGWLKIWKTGETWQDTKYHAEIAKKTSPKFDAQGRNVGEDVAFVSEKVSEFLIKSFDIKDLPTFRAVALKSAFTPEESIAFAANPLLTPQRILGESNSDAERNADIADSNGATTSEEALSDLGMPSSYPSGLSDIDNVL
jgi:hypothetical protein